MLFAGTLVAAITGQLHLSNFLGARSRASLRSALGNGTAKGEVVPEWHLSDEVPSDKWARGASLDAIPRILNAWVSLAGYGLSP